MNLFACECHEQIVRNIPIQWGRFAKKMNEQGVFKEQ